MKTVFSHRPLESVLGTSKSPWATMNQWYVLVRTYKRAWKCKEARIAKIYIKNTSRESEHRIENPGKMWYFKKASMKFIGGQAYLFDK